MNRRDSNEGKKGGKNLVDDEERLLWAALFEALAGLLEAVEELGAELRLRSEQQRKEIG